MEPLKITYPCLIGQDASIVNHPFVRYVEFCNIAVLTIVELLQNITENCANRIAVFQIAGQAMASAAPVLVPQANNFRLGFEWNKDFPVNEQIEQLPGFSPTAQDDVGAFVAAMNWGFTIIHRAAYGALPGRFRGIPDEDLAANLAPDFVAGRAVPLDHCQLAALGIARNIAILLAWTADTALAALWVDPSRLQEIELAPAAPVDAAPVRASKPAKTAKAAKPVKAPKVSKPAKVPKVSKPAKAPKVATAG